MTADDFKNIALCLGLLFFIYKYALGYLMINVSLEASARRVLQKEQDAVVVAVKVKKGERECLQLDKLRIAVEGDHTEITKNEIDFSAPEAPAGRLRMSPGEESLYEFAFLAPKTEVLAIEIKLTGWSGPITKMIPGYWRARLVSVPNEKKTTEA